MFRKMRFRAGQYALIMVLMLVVGGGCTHDFTRFVAGSNPPPLVPELDYNVINLDNIQQWSSREDIRAILGEPSFVHDFHGDGRLLWTSWWYPIRSIGAVPLPAGAKAQRSIIPAAALKIWLNSSGQVDQWGFFNPITNSRLEIRESIKEADSRFRTMCKPPKRIELSDLLRRGRPKEDVVKGMRWFDGLIVARDWEDSQVRLSRKGEQEILVYYADHPSPLFVPSNYLVVTFYTSGHGTRMHYEGWGGCK
jgi:hypothetical protein